MSSWYKYLIVNIAFSHLGFWSGNLFLIVPFPDLCLLVLFTPVVFFFLYENRYKHLLQAAISYSSSGDALELFYVCSRKLMTSSIREFLNLLTA